MDGDGAVGLGVGDAGEDCVCVGKRNERNANKMCETDCTLASGMY